MAFVPIFAVVCTTAVQRTPWYQAYQKSQWQQRISNNLGIDVQFASIAFPAPEHFRIRQLVCNHPETGKEILRIAQVNASMDRSGWTVDLVSPELNGAQIQVAKKIIHDWFLCRPQKSASLLKLNVPQLAVYDGLESTRFQNVEVGLRPTDTVSTLWLRFSIEGQLFTERANLKVERHHALASPTTNWSFDSHDVAIPCKMLAGQFPSFRLFGEQAYFRGGIDWNLSDERGLAELRGTFESVDLGTATARVGSPIRGKANVSIDRAVIGDDRLQWAQGAILSVQGNTVDPAWVMETVNRLRLPTAAAVTTTPSTATSIRLKFQLSPAGLMLVGQLRPSHNDYPIAMVNNNPIYGTTRWPISVMQVRDWLQSTSTGLSAESISSFLPWPAPNGPTSGETQPPRIATDRR